MKRTLITMVTALTALSLAALPSLAAPPAHADINKQLAQVRQATVQYQDVAVAIADGYVPPDFGDPHACVPEMGYHFVNPAAIGTPVSPAAPDALAPSILVYAPLHNGRLKLVAVEYASWVPAELLGQTFDPPAAEGEPGPPFYTLHAWVWQGNPDGVFEAHNPNVAC